MYLHSIIFRLCTCTSYFSDYVLAQHSFPITYLHNIFSAYILAQHTFPIMYLHNIVFRLYTFTIYFPVIYLHSILFRLCTCTIYFPVIYSHSMLFWLCTFSFHRLMVEWKNETCCRKGNKWTYSVPVSRLCGYKPILHCKVACSLNHYTSKSVIFKGFLFQTSHLAQFQYLFNALMRPDDSLIKLKHVAR
jgi:hypothetical protein